MKETVLDSNGGFWCLCCQFAAQEEKRQKNERLHQHQKHENQMRDLQLQCDANVRELQQLQVNISKASWTHLLKHVLRTDVNFYICGFQNEKCHLLIEHETQKLKELDEEHSLELKEWREKLRPRKKVSMETSTKPHSSTDPFDFGFDSSTCSTINLVDLGEFRVKFPSSCFQ